MQTMTIERRLKNYKVMRAQAGKYKRVKQLYLPAQSDFVFNYKSPILSFTGGLGAGKTEAFVLWCLQRGIINSPNPGLVVEPTYYQLENVFMDTLLNILHRWNTPHEHMNYNSKSHILTLKLNGRVFQMHLKSADKAKNLAGANVSWAGVDEADFVPFGLITQIRARVRRKNTALLQTAFVGTPERLGGWWQKMCELKPDPNNTWIRSSSRDNVFLPPTYIDTQLSHLGKEEKRQYVEGYWVNISGTVYKGFQEDKHAYPMKYPSFNDEFVMACDFGTGCMAWGLGVKRGDHVHIFDEIIESGIYTDQASVAAQMKWQYWFKEWFGDHLSPDEAAYRVTAYIDPMGNDQRKVTVSDGRTMKNHGFNVDSSFKPLDVRMRVMTLNRCCREDKISIDPAGAPHFLKSILTQGYDKNMEPQKWHSRDGTAGMDHSNDALGYLTDRLWGMEYSRSYTDEY